jgi:hypothetical protein
MRPMSYVCGHCGKTNDLRPQPRVKAPPKSFPLERWEDVPPERRLADDFAWTPTADEHRCQAAVVASEWMNRHKVDFAYKRRRCPWQRRADSPYCCRHQRKALQGELVTAS